MLNGTHISDRGAAHLASLSRLRVLSLANTPLTDSGLEHFENLKELSIICLADTRVSATGLVKIREKLANTDVDVLGYPMTERVAAQRTLAEDQLRILANALEAYKIDVGDYPADSPGLNALLTSPDASTRADWNGPYLYATPIPPFIRSPTIGPAPSEHGGLVSRFCDPWGKAYRYQLDERSDSLRIWSVGPDGSNGTRDDIVAAADPRNTSVEGRWWFELPQVASDGRT